MRGQVREAKSMGGSCSCLPGQGDKTVDHWSMRKLHSSLTCCLCYAIYNYDFTDWTGCSFGEIEKKNKSSEVKIQTWNGKLFTLHSSPPRGINCSPLNHGTASEIPLSLVKNLKLDHNWQCLLNSFPSATSEWISQIYAYLAKVLEGEA